MLSFGRNTLKFSIKQSYKSFGTYKTSTGLVGLEVDPNGRENLLKLSAKVLDSVKVIFLFCILSQNSYNKLENTCRKRLSSKC